MSLITSINHNAWQTLANDLSRQYPGVGKQVRVIAGRHIGRVGVVRWHGRDKFASTRYKTDAQLTLQDMCGREGFRVRVESGGECFFVAAEKVEVINA